MNFIQTFNQVSDFSLEYVTAFTIISRVDKKTKQEAHRIEARLIDGHSYPVYETKTFESAVQAKSELIKQLVAARQPKKQSYSQKLKALFTGK